ncbi:uncharacterized protein LOC107627785 [Arachis ipaensis]|uniref:uncharacterized protein LOC107627785 n=1 Tax=Arachis ipaensis TaxID=130454 RepID=UPI0007AF0C28|nr:uncharacterized protein LOC107627785 [Arachis ipaensis]XP_025636392.1 uncharacterized protein LOC112730526 [Arachis hypogaea]
MGEKNDGLVDVYFEHAVSTPKILEGNEIVVYVEGDHDDLREVSDEPDNEPLQDKIPNQTNIPTVPTDETPFTNNNEPTHNTSPPKSTEPTDPGANNRTPKNIIPLPHPTLILAKLLLQSMLARLIQLSQKLNPIQMPTQIRNPILHHPPRPMPTRRIPPSPSPSPTGILCPSPN